MLQSGRLILDGLGPGDWNMAVDEALLSTSTGAPVLRFYGWSEPTLSLGYFQRCDDRRLHPASLGCPVVRRASGGGAILHDRELTYSLVLPAGHPLSSRAQMLYRAVHAALIEALGELLPVDAGLCGATPVSGGKEPFLCFERRGIGDVVVQARCGPDASVKVAGSAQRRYRGAVLQHGSVLLARSDSAPELAGLEDLSGGKIPSARLAAVWGQHLERLLGMLLGPALLTEAEQSLAERLASQKYGSALWNQRR